jgi:3-oxoacyl-[acyl-carrier-protein] synthase II
MNKRIVITGIGAVGPLGHDLHTIAANLGRSPDETGHGTSRKLNEQSELWMLRGLDASGTLSGRLQRKLDPFSVHGMVAAGMALASSGIDGAALDPHAVGIYVGNCLGGWGYTQPELEALHTRGVTGMGPYVATAWFPAALQGQLSLVHGFKGHSKTFSARDVAGLQAIGHAADAIRHERAQVVLCGASEDLSSPYMQAVLQRYARANDTRGTAGAGATPFGALESTTFSDGAAFLMLEELAHAQRRGARVLCEITGFGDRFCSAPEHAAPVLARALQAAEGRREGERLLVLDGLSSGEAAITADAARSAGIRITPVDSRSALGNQFAVSGVTEVVLAAQALAEGRVRPEQLGQRRGGTGGEFVGALIQRLSPQGNVTTLGLSAA